jgi:hypothetical protein
MLANSQVVAAFEREMRCLLEREFVSGLLHRPLAKGPWA